MKYDGAMIKRAMTETLLSAIVICSSFEDIIEEEEPLFKENGQAAIEKVMTSGFDLEKKKKVALTLWTMTGAMSFNEEFLSTHVLALLEIAKNLGLTVEQILPPATVEVMKNTPLDNSTLWEFVLFVEKKDKDGVFNEDKEWATTVASLVEALMEARRQAHASKIN